jgi:hypothetical protein
MWLAFVVEAHVTIIGSRGDGPCVANVGLDRTGKQCPGADGHSDS